MRKVLHISQNQYKPLGENGSTERIWNELSRDFDEYHVLGRSRDNRFHDYRNGKIFLHTVPKIGRRNSWFAVTGLLVGRYIRKYKIDIVISQCPVLGGLWAVKYGKKHNIPVMVEIHGAEYFRLLESKRLKQKIGAALLRYSFKNACLVRVLNDDMKRRLEELGINGDNIRVVYNRADFRLFNKPKENFKLHDPVKLITVGAFSKLKGHDLIFDAIRSLKDKGIECQLTLIGGGDYFEHFRKRSIEENIPCVIRGRVSQAEIVELMSDCDIYIHSSYTEAVSRAIIEAMAMRMPIIATDVGFTKGTVYDNKSALLVPPGDASAIEKAVQRLVDDENLRKNIANEAYSDAKSNYEWNHCFDGYRKLLEELYAMKR